MHFNDYISNQMTRAIKSNTSRSEREVIAVNNGISIHTLNTVITGERKVTSFNATALTELIKLAIRNANKNGKTLSEYYHKAKGAAEATPLKVNNH